MLHDTPLAILQLLPTPHAAILPRLAPMFSFMWSADVYCKQATVLGKGDMVTKSQNCELGIDGMRESVWRLVALTYLHGYRLHKQPNVRYPKR